MSLSGLQEKARKGRGDFLTLLVGLEDVHVALVVGDDLHTRFRIQTKYIPSTLKQKRFYRDEARSLANQTVSFGERLTARLRALLSQGAASPGLGSRSASSVTDCLSLHTESEGIERNTRGIASNFLTSKPTKEVNTHPG